MRPILRLLLLFISLSCQKDINPDTRLYGKWVVVGGSVLQKRQFIATQTLYFNFNTDGNIKSNYGSCYSFRLGEPGELIATNVCVDCAIGTADCGRETWRYTFPAPYELNIDFGTLGIGYFRR